MKYEIKSVLSEGYVKAKAISFKFHSDNEEVLSKEREFEKLEMAIGKTKTQFERMIDENNDLSDYLNILILIATDPELKKNCQSRIKIGLSAKGALYDVMNKTNSEILKSTSSYLRERTSDVSDVLLRIASNIDNKNEFTEIDDFILRTEILYPSFLIQKRKNLVGVIVDKGGYTSHAAIMCRAFDIPLVISDCDIKYGDTVIIDSRKKIIDVNPSSEDIKEFDKEYEIRNSYPKHAISHEGFKFLANVSTNYELDKVLDYGFDGIGLYRTEMIFMYNDRPYSFDEQKTIYTEAVEKLKDKTIVFRTFDVGDDKNLSYLRVEDKGVRNYFNNPVIFETQVKAILSSNKYDNLSIMFPMIETYKDFKELRKWVIKIAKKNKYKIPKIGMMLETKSALETIKKFKHVDFISVGTNDLSKELYNVDRNQGVSDISYARDLTKKLSVVVAYAAKKKISLSICGELASIKDVAIMFYKIGVRNLSVSPSLIRILNMSLEEFKNIPDKK
ncbi:MAG: hypothetical protein K6E20_00330 [Acholeplasmatales bacterium]|nr:hypothetical protein [Acholeplasmatales bacterium]